MTQISKLAAVDPEAQLGKNVRVGPFCVIGPDVTIDDGCELMNNVTIQGITRIGQNNVFYPNVVIGTAPQDLKYDGAPTETIIDYGNVFREGCTVHRGTELGGGRTVIGKENLFMAFAHVAHDCHVADKTIIGNQTLLAGHVAIEDGAIVSAMIGLHHFVTVGKYSYIAAMTPVRRDVPPFTKFSGDPNEVRAINEEGLKRNGLTADNIAALKRAFRTIFRNDASVSAGLDELEGQETLDENVRYLCQFMRQSCQARFGRYRESARTDLTGQKRRRDPFEIRLRDRRRENRS